MTADDIVKQVEAEKSISPDVSGGSETPTTEATEAVETSRAEATKAETTEATKAEAKPKRASTRKKVNLDEELAKKRGTFAVGIQAAMRDKIRNR